MVMLAFSAIFISFAKEHKPLRRLLKVFVGTMFGVGIFIMLVARAFLLVESFLALRYLNEEAFQSVAWVHTWPHFG